MAFTNAPTNDTYSTHIVPLLIDLQMDQGESSPSLSAGMTNIVPIKNKRW